MDASPACWLPEGSLRVSTKARQLCHGWLAGPKGLAQADTLCAARALICTPLYRVLRAALLCVNGSELLPDCPGPLVQVVTRVAGSWQ